MNEHSVVHITLFHQYISKTRLYVFHQRAIPIIYILSLYFWYQIGGSFEIIPKELLVRIILQFVTLNINRQLSYFSEVQIKKGLSLLN